MADTNPVPGASPSTDDPLEGLLHGGMGFQNPLGWVDPSRTGPHDGGEERRRGEDRATEGEEDARVQPTRDL